MKKKGGCCEGQEGHVSMDEIECRFRVGGNAKRREEKQKNLNKNYKRKKMKFITKC